MFQATSDNSSSYYVLLAEGGLLLANPCRRALLRYLLQCNLDAVAMRALLFALPYPLEAVLREVEVLRRLELLVLPKGLPDVDTHLHFRRAACLRKLGTLKELLYDEGFAHAA